MAARSIVISKPRYLEILSTMASARGVSILQSSFDPSPDRYTVFYDADNEAQKLLEVYISNSFNGWSGIEQGN